MRTTSEARRSLPAFIGGSGLYALQGYGTASTLTIATPWQGEAVNLQYYADHAQPFLFLPRHGAGHHLAPHQIPYRANLWALHHAGASRVVALNTVGGIGDAMQPGSYCLPDQLIDYTWGREATFHDAGGAGPVAHVDFTEPFSAALGDLVAAAAAAMDLPLVRGGVYGCTQGPRLETAAEIRRLQRDGCDVVGMTAMPEAVLARELALDYCCVALVVNRAAGLPGADLDMTSITARMAAGRGRWEALIRAVLPALAG